MPVEKTVGFYKYPDSLSIMILEKSPVLVEVINTCFPEYYKVYGCSGIETLKEKIELNKPELIIIDSMYALAERKFLVRYIKKNLPDSLSLIVTNITELKEWVVETNVGQVYCLLKKPLNIESLKQTIYRAKVDYHNKKIEKKWVQALSRQAEFLRQVNNSKKQFIEQIFNSLDESIMGIKKTLNNLPFNLNDLHRSVLGLTDTVNDLKDLGIKSIIQNDGIDNSYSVESLVEKIVKETKDILMASKLNLSISGLDKNVFIMIDPDSLIFIIKNIIEGFVFSSQKGGSIHWELRIFETAIESVFSSSKTLNLKTNKLPGFQKEAVLNLIEKFGGYLGKVVSSNQQEIILHLPRQY